MFGTSGVRGEVGSEVTADLALSVGRALASTGYDRVVVGRDARESGLMLTDALTAGLRECGADVVVLGRAATPTVARAVGWHDADAGVSVTASHNPAPDNGLKLWTPSGRAFDESQREAIAEAVRTEAFDLQPSSRVGRATESSDAADRHVAALEAAVSVAADLDVVVDVGNGTGQVSARALRRLGCDVTTLDAIPDGEFPSRPSEPTAENCSRLSAVVAGTDADFGVAHDGDADRMMAVDETGAFVGGDLLLALFARRAAGEGDRVAAPLNTSLAVDDALAEVGASLVRTRVGDVYVAERAEEDDVAFGGEPSGAWIWPAETLCPDGPLAACRLAELVADEGPLGDRLADVEEYPIRRTSVRTDDKERHMAAVRDRVLDRYDSVDTMDGVRVEVDGGWFLVRASGTQPLVRVTAEARTEDRADELFERARELVESAAPEDPA